MKFMSVVYCGLLLAAVSTANAGSIAVVSTNHVLSARMGSATQTASGTSGLPNFSVSLSVDQDPNQPDSPGGIKEMISFSSTTQSIETSTYIDVFGGGPQDVVMAYSYLATTFEVVDPVRYSFVNRQSVHGFDVYNWSMLFQDLGRNTILHESAGSMAYEDPDDIVSVTGILLPGVYALSSVHSVYYAQGFTDVVVGQSAKLNVRAVSEEGLTAGLLIASLLALAATSRPNRGRR